MRNKINPLTELWISNELTIVGLIKKETRDFYSGHHCIVNVQILITLSVTFAY